MSDILTSLTSTVSEGVQEMQGIPVDYFFCPYWLLQVVCLVFGCFGILLGWYVHSRRWWFESLVEKYLVKRNE